MRSAFSLCRSATAVQSDDALAHAHALLHAHDPPRDGTDHPRIRFLHEKAEATLRSEATEHERVVDRGEVLAPHGELGLALGAAAIVTLGVLGGGARVV